MKFTLPDKALIHGLVYDVERDGFVMVPTSACGQPSKEFFSSQAAALVLAARLCLLAASYSPGAALGSPHVAVDGSRWLLERAHGDGRSFMKLLAVANCKALAGSYAPGPGVRSIRDCENVSAAAPPSPNRYGSREREST